MIVNMIRSLHNNYVKIPKIKFLFNKCITHKEIINNYYS
jgi:hypothetical protein